MTNKEFLDRLKKGPVFIKSPCEIDGCTQTATCLVSESDNRQFGKRIPAIGVCQEHIEAGVATLKERQ